MPCSTAALVSVWSYSTTNAARGDHKHILEVETPYEFTAPDKLTEDFEAAVRAVQQGKGKADD